MIIKCDNNDGKIIIPLLSKLRNYTKQVVYVYYSLF